MVAVEIGFAHLGIHGYTAIIAYVFVSTRSKVEEGSLAAVRISHQCHVDDAVESFCFLFSQGFVAGIVFSFSHEHLVAERLLVAIVGIYYFRGNYLLAVFFFRLAELCIVLGFINGNHLDMVGFAVSERHLVTHNLVFHWVLEWGVKEYIYLLALDESHLDDSLSEATVS